MIKFPPGKLPRGKSVTLETFSFPKETVNKSSFSRAKVCSVTTANVTIFSLFFQNNKLFFVEN